MLEVGGGLSQEFRGIVESTKSMVAVNTEQAANGSCGVVMVNIEVPVLAWPVTDGAAVVLSGEHSIVGSDGDAVSLSTIPSAMAHRSAGGTNESLSVWSRRWREVCNRLGVVTSTAKAFGFWLFRRFGLWSEPCVSITFPRVRLFCEAFRRPFHATGTRAASAVGAGIAAIHLATECNNRRPSPEVFTASRADLFDSSARSSIASIVEVSCRDIGVTEPLTHGRISESEAVTDCKCAQPFIQVQASKFVVRWPTSVSWASTPSASGTVNTGISQPRLDGGSTPSKLFSYGVNAQALNYIKLAQRVVWWAIYIRGTFGSHASLHRGLTFYSQFTTLKDGVPLLS